MKEILTNTLSDIYYQIFKNGQPIDADGEVTVSISFGDSVISGEATKVEGEVGRYSYMVPTSLVTQEGKLEASWTFTVGGQALTVSEAYRVVTPYSTWDYFSRQPGDFSYEDYLECERVSRYVINAYCGQHFGKWAGTIGVDGNGDNTLVLPARLLELKDVHWEGNGPMRSRVRIAAYGGLQWEITPDRWCLRVQPHRTSLDPVYNPPSFFKRNRIYEISGVWGWESVPGGVVDASKILTADYLCNEHKYRDKYLESLKVDDWRFQFNEMAFVGTGNATVDKILTDYRNLPGLGVI